MRTLVVVLLKIVDDLHLGPRLLLATKHLEELHLGCELLDAECGDAQRAWEQRERSQSSECRCARSRFVCCNAIFLVVNSC